MRKHFPWFFSLLIGALKPLILMLSDRYDLAMIPGDLFYSGLAYDVWLSGQLRGEDRAIDNTEWLMILVLVHLIGHVAFVILALSYGEWIVSNLVASLIVAGILTYGGPLTIAFKPRGRANG